MKNMNFKRKLPVPKEIKEQYPLTAALAAVKEARDLEIADISEVVQGCGFGDRRHLHGQK